MLRASGLPNQARCLVYAATVSRETFQGSPYVGVTLGKLDILRRIERGFVVFVRTERVSRHTYKWENVT